MSSDSSDYSSDEETQTKKSKPVSSFVMNADFQFESNTSKMNKPVDAWSFSKICAQQPMQKNSTSINQKIQRVLERKARMEERRREDVKSRQEEEEQEEENSQEENKEEEEDKEEQEDNEEEEEKDENNDMGVVRALSQIEPSVSGRPDRVSFASLHLSKPLLRAVADLGFETATPIQAATIPIALKGADILANAVTGSGKTAAFMLPVLERLLFRPRRIPMMRVLVLTPTRELAAQCQSMTEQLARHTDITVALVVGGLSMQPQEAALRARPDICVATPGRLIDHLRNSQSVHLEDIEILILDEADRLLELGFLDEIKEIVKQCRFGRQTMLFSATMSDQVLDLVNLSLHNPQKIVVDPFYSLADHLKQEFIRIRASQEVHREAMLVALCQRSFTSRVIIFFRSKHHCHRMMIIFGLLQLNAAELHGNLTQTQRLESLEKFRCGTVNFLLCTDLAARGLDIAGVETVINFSFPPQLSQYIHRVGRTARAGKQGRSITLVGEKQRILLKEVIKRAPSSVQSRVLPEKIVSSTFETVQKLENDVMDVLQAEKLEKDLRVAEMQTNKANNMLVHHQEIISRPKKTWFQTEQEKQDAKLSGKPDDSSDDEKNVKTKKTKSVTEKDKEKKDPYAGMSRKQRRRRMQIDQEKKDLAERELNELEDGSISEIKKKVTKKDLEAAAVKLQSMRHGERLVAKSIKKQMNRSKKESEDEPSQPVLGKRKGESAIRYGTKSKNPDTFAARYRGTTDEKPKEESNSGKPFRVKSKKSFKSKSRYQRRVR